MGGLVSKVDDYQQQECKEGNPADYDVGMSREDVENILQDDFNGDIFDQNVDEIGNLLLSRLKTLILEQDEKLKLEREKVEELRRIAASISKHRRTIKKMVKEKESGELLTDITAKMEQEIQQFLEVGGAPYQVANDELVTDTLENYYEVVGGADIATVSAFYCDTCRLVITGSPAICGAQQIAQAFYVRKL